MESLARAALGYAQRGWAPIPLSPAAKVPAAGFPLRKYLELRPGREQVRRWWIATPKANVGLVMGHGLIAVDMDRRHGGDNSVRGMYLPPTFVSETSDGFHLLYQMKGAPRKRISALPGVDLIGRGGYIVAPPSLHPSGKRYVLSIDEPPVPAPKWLRDLLLEGPVTSKVPCAKDLPPEAREVLEGERNDTLFTLGCGFMRGKCAWCAGRPCSSPTAGHLYKRLFAFNLKQCEPPLDRAEVWHIASNAFDFVRRSTPADSSKPHGTNHSNNYGNDQRLATESLFIRARTMGRA